jgi:endonuclease YncB( thermonuclease family)
MAMYTYFTKIDKVVDGDTVDVFIDLGFNVWHKERIRLAGIDTAEKNTAFGKATKKLLIDIRIFCSNNEHRSVR